MRPSIQSSSLPSLLPVAALSLAVLLPGGARAAQVPDLELVAQYGCAECSGPELLGQIQDLVVTADGEVFVLDRDAPVVRVFPRAGEASAFGRLGEGPGEFTLAAFAARLPDGGLEVIDTRARRMTRFDAEHQFVATRPLQQFPFAAAYSSAASAWYLAIIDWSTFGSTVMRLPDGADGLERLGAGDFPLDAEGNLKDFFPLAARPGGGYAVGDGELEYRIRLYGPGGRVEGDIVREIARVRMTSAEIAAEEERRQAAAGRRAQMAAAEGGSPGALPEIDPLKRHFYVHALRFDGAGRLWVLTGRGDETTSVFDVFGSNQAYLGEVRIDGVVRRFDLAGQWLASAGEDADYLPRVRLWRVR